MQFIGALVRFLVASVVILFVSWLVPQFVVGTFMNAVLFALVIAGIGWAIEAVTGRSINPFRRGVIGFIASAITIYVAQFIVSGVVVTIWGALLAAFVIGIIDLFIPVSTPFQVSNKRAHSA